MHVNIRCRRVADSLVPADTAAAFAIKAWKSDLINVELQDEKRMHSRQQAKFWWGIVVPTISELWRQEKGWAVAPDKSVIHGAIVGAVFGLVETPLGPTRRSSTTLTLEEYMELIDWAKSYCLEKYKVSLPDPSEG